MNLQWQQLINLPVRTKSGQALGVLVGFELNGETHEIRVYHVKPRGLIKGLLRQELLIAREQVVSLNQEEMVVDDALVEAAARSTSSVVAVAPKGELGVTSQLNSLQD